MYLIYSSRIHATSLLLTRYISFPTLLLTRYIAFFNSLVDSIHSFWKSLVDLIHSLLKSLIYSMYDLVLSTRHISLHYSNIQLFYIHSISLLSTRYVSFPTLLVIYSIYDLVLSIRITSPIDLLYNSSLLDINLICSISNSSIDSIYSSHIHSISLLSTRYIAFSTLFLSLHTAC